MDPNEALRLIRAYVKQMAVEDRHGSSPAPAMFEQHARNLAETIAGLDEWLSKGGFPPREWSKLRQSDTEVVDKIAVGLGTQETWSGADALEWIANVIGDVRPHPGDSADHYVRTFRIATGRDPDPDYIDDDYCGED